MADEAGPWWAAIVGWAVIVGFMLTVHYVTIGTATIARHLAYLIRKVRAAHARGLERAGARR